ncbi:MAG: hypothetical protein ACK43J_04130, partial [Chitinophagaceae bacterium]
MIFVFRLLLIALALSVTVSSYSQLVFTWNEKCQHVYQSITALRIPEAKRWLLEEKKKNPQNTAWLFLDSHADLYPLFFSEDPTEYQQFLKKSESRIDKLEETSSTTPYHRYA